MLRWILLLFALSLAALGLLNRVTAPAWAPWKAGVLAGEYGHWLAALALALAAGALGQWRHGAAVAGATLGLSLTAAGLLFIPAWQASRLAPEVRAQFQARFGRAPEISAFSWRQLYVGPSVEPVSVRTVQVGGTLPMDVYAPATSLGPRPGVVVVHGGGWDSGDRREIVQLNHWLAREGYVVAAVSYRLAPEFRWPAPREDLAAALAHLKAHADELQLDASRLVLLGRSAGGQIALASAYGAVDPAIRGVVGLYSPSDLIFGYVNTVEDDMLKSPALMRQYLGGPPESARPAYESASALFHVGPRTPPTLLVHGENDALVWFRHSVRLDARLAEQGIPRVFVALPWATHAMEYNLNGPGGQLTRYALRAFLEATTRK